MAMISYKTFHYPCNSLGTIVVDAVQMTVVAITLYRYIEMNTTRYFVFIYIPNNSYSVNWNTNFLRFAEYLGGIFQLTFLWVLKKCIHQIKTNGFDTVSTGYKMRKVFQIWQWHFLRRMFELDARSYLIQHEQRYLF